MEQVVLNCVEPNCKRTMFRCSNCRTTFKPEIISQIVDIDLLGSKSRLVEEICDKNHLKRSLADLYESDEEVKQPLNKKQKTYGLNK